MALTQGGLTAILAKRFKNHQILRFTFLAMAGALYLQILPTNTSQLLLVSPLIAIFVGLTIANSTALVSTSAGKEIQGEVLGIEASVQALAQSIPAIISGYIATLGVNMPVIVGSVIIACGGVLFNVFYRAPKKIVSQ